MLSSPQIQQGNVMNIIEEHYRGNYRVLVKRIKWKTHNEQDAEDIVQEAYARAIKYKDAFLLGVDFKLWFGRILSNVVKDFIRDRFQNGFHQEFDEEHDDLVIDNQHIFDILRSIEEDINVTNDEVHKEILLLYHILGFPIRSIVDITNMKYKMVDTVIHRFKKKMEERYA